MKRKLFGVLMLFLVFLTIYSIINFFSPNLSSKLTSDNILKVAPGMTLEQVFDIIGRPIKVTALHGIHKIGCNNPNSNLDEGVNNNTDIRLVVHDFISTQKYCCTGNKRDLEEFNGVTLVYTERGFITSYPMLWVHVDTSFKVTNIAAKKYESGLFGDDPGIYGFGWAMDSTYTKYNYAKTEKWINREKFYSCFH